MARYIAGRAGQLALTLLGVSIVIFLLVRLLPGDVAAVHVRDAALPQVPGLELPDV